MCVSEGARGGSRLAKGSAQITNDVILDLIVPRLHPEVQLLDFGAGAGYMAQRLGSYLSNNGMEPQKHLVACEISPEKFQYSEIECHALLGDSRIPFPDGRFDLIYAIEVLEHVPRPYDFFQEAHRKLKKDGVLLFSVPNFLQMKSRFQFLLTGFGDLYGPPSAHEKNAGRICGHIMPLSYPYLHYGLRKAGFRSIRFHMDRRKKGASFLAVLLFPLLRWSSWSYARALKKYDLEVWEETREIVREVNSLRMLSSRSCILSAQK